MDPARWEGVLAMTLVVRDEGDVLGANLRYHLNQGVDVILVVDHGSSDATPEILDEFASDGRVRWFREDDRPHDQVRRVSRLLKVAAEEHGADWVIHCDADEFWATRAGTLRDVFAAVPQRYGYMIVERNNFIPEPGEPAPFYEHMTVRERRTLNLRGLPLEPKVAQRPHSAAAVTPGNHDLEDPTMPPAPDVGAVEVLHFPFRSFAQMERKVVSTGVGYELLADRGPGIGGDQLTLLDMHRRGALREYYEQEMRTPTQRAEQLEAGELLVDLRVQRGLGEAPPERESRYVQELLARAWGCFAERDDELGAAEQRATDDTAAQASRAEEFRAALTAAEQREQQAAGELAHARAEIEDLVARLDAIRNSRLMRATAPMRRTYYRARDLARRPTETRR